jgi:hypothetical protein
LHEGAGYDHIYGNQIYGQAEEDKGAVHGGEELDVCATWLVSRKITSM